MQDFSFGLYLIALILAPPIVAHHLGLRAAMQSAAMEAALVVAAWLFILALFFTLRGAGPALSDLTGPITQGAPIWLGLIGMFGTPLFALTALALILPGLAVLIGAGLAVAWWVVVTQWRSLRSK